MSKYSDLTKERSFWELYLEMRKIPVRKDNLIIYIVSLLAILIFNFLTLNDCREAELNSLSNNVISWSLSILGFAIAGYAIFSTLSDKSLQISMSEIKHPDYDLDYLRVAHLNILKPIVDFILIVVLSFIIGKFSILLVCNDYLYVFMESILDSFLVFIAISAKSFVFNIFSGVMTSIRWYAETKNSEND